MNRNEVRIFLYVLQYWLPKSATRRDFIQLTDAEKPTDEANVCMWLQVQLKAAECVYWSSMRVIQNINIFRKIPWISNDNT